MGTEWVAVAEAINTRLDELGMTQNELAVRSGVSTATLRELQHNRNPRRRSKRLLEAVSQGLRWPAGHLSRVLGGDVDTGTGADDWRAEVGELRDELRDVQRQLGELNQRVSAALTDRQN
jgi:transcriptional regulator with XRE-family HTH domain